MHNRLDLQVVLERCMSDPHVYFQPPSNQRMKYPAIRYEVSNIPRKDANNESYKINHEYKIVVMDSDPESEIVSKVSQLPRCRYATHYVVDGLYHDVFYLYY